MKKKDVVSKYDVTSQVKRMLASATARRDRLGKELREVEDLISRLTPVVESMRREVTK